MTFSNIFLNLSLGDSLRISLGISLSFSLGISLRGPWVSPVDAELSSIGYQIAVGVPREVKVLQLCRCEVGLRGEIFRGEFAL